MTYDRDKAFEYYLKFEDASFKDKFDKKLLPQSMNDLIDLLVYKVSASADGKVLDTMVKQTHLALRSQFPDFTNENKFNDFINYDKIDQGKKINLKIFESYVYLSVQQKNMLRAYYYAWQIAYNIDKSSANFQSIYEKSISTQPYEIRGKYEPQYFKEYDNNEEDYDSFRKVVNDLLFGGDVLIKAARYGSGVGVVVQASFGTDHVLNIYSEESDKVPSGGGILRLSPEARKRAEMSAIQRRSEENLSTLTAGELRELFSSGSTDSLQWSIEQCILLTSLKTFAEKRKDDRIASLKTGSVDYGGRVIPVHCAPPQAFVNFLNCPPYSYHYTKEITTEMQQDIEYDFVIAKVKEDVSGILKEYPFNFGKSDDEIGSTEAKISKIKLDYANPDSPNTTITGSEAISQAISISPENLNTSISFKKVSIDFKGENFATAKTNVDVTLEIEVLSLLLLQAEFEDTLPGVDGKEYTYSLVELFTYLNKSNVTNGTGASRIFKTAYSPDYNRLIMKIIPKIVKGRSISDERIEKFIDESQLILDLALVDYTIKKDEVLQKATITINYKGFIRSYLNEPIADCITPVDVIRRRIGAEKKLIEELETGFCDYRDANEKIAKYFKAQKILSDSRNKTAPRTKIIKDLVQRGKIYFFKYKPMSILRGNVDKRTKKLINPSRVAEIMKDNNDLFRIERALETIDMDGEINLKGEERLSYFYLGDLIDVLMDFMYGEYSTTNQNRTIDTVKHKYLKNFPLKIILPTFYPNILKEEDGQTYFKTSDSDLVNLADIPVAVEWFKKWFEEEVIKKDLRHYPIGMFLNKLVNSLVNNVLNDDCYLMGNFERKYFSVKSDFGLFKLNDNSDYKGKNSTFFDRRFANSGKKDSWASFDKKDIPIIYKNDKVDRLDNCNYLIVYEQMNAFTDYSNFGVAGDLEKAFGEFEVPTFRLRRLNSLNQPTSFVKSIGFSKSDIPYQREARFQGENLNSLAQLASVHNAKITTLPFLNIYPGMLCWVDVGLQDAPNKYGSVAWLLGMGGYHITKQVTHTANISGNRIVGSSFQTVIDAVYVNNGAGNQNTLCKKTKEVEIRDPQPDNSGVKEAVEGEVPGEQTVLREESIPNNNDTKEVQPESSEDPSFENLETIEILPNLNLKFPPGSETIFVASSLDRDGRRHFLPSDESGVSQIELDGYIYFVCTKARAEKASSGHKIKLIREKIA